MAGFLFAPGHSGRDVSDEDVDEILAAPEVTTLLKTNFMNKEIGYIWQGTFFVLVILAGMWFVNVLASIERPMEVEENSMQGFCGTVDEPIGKYRNTNSAGAKLFNDNCATCHKVDKDLTGPALRGIEDRVTDKKLLYAWIRNNQSVLKTGNAYFTGLYNKWNQTPMNVFLSLTDDEIAAILAYIRENKVTVLP